MMPRFAVSNLAQHVSVRKVPTNAYRLAPHGRWAFLGSAMWKLLRKLDFLSEYVEDREDITYTSIDTDDVMRRILESQHSVVEYLQGAGETLLIGPEEFRELMGHVPRLSGFSFHSEYASRHTLFGLRVCVIPQMKGVLVLRKKDLE
jgi:hypothetical protein